MPHLLLLGCFGRGVEGCQGLGLLLVNRLNGLPQASALVLVVGRDFAFLLQERSVLFVESGELAGVTLVEQLLGI